MTTPHSPRMQRRDGLLDVRGNFGFRLVVEDQHDDRYFGMGLLDLVGGFEPVLGPESTGSTA
jgi:hypothetical protein